MTYHTTAKGLAALGRNGDSMLMHVNPQEVAALSKILGPTTTNPKTGLPEAYGWTSMLGSALTGMGSFGIGAALNPVIEDALGGATSDLMKEVIGKAVPALAGAGIGAAIGGATGGKGGAMGGALQGGLSGGLGAYASEDILGAPSADTGEAKANISEDPTSIAKGLGSKPTPAESLFGKGPMADLQDPTESADRAVSDSLRNSSRPGFLDNLSTVGKTAFSKEGFKKMEDYASPLFMAGMLGQGVESSYAAQDQAKKNEEDYRRYQQQQRINAQNYANQVYSGYADGGPVQFQTQGPVPVSVHIPEHAVEEAKRAGGIGSFMSFANGGYINTQPFSPDQFHPQSRIPSAQPYAAASPQRAEVVDQQGAMYAQGGLLDGEGDGMSDDIDANIEGEEPVRVADGEFVVPKHIVDMIGVDRLDELLKSVRMAAYGREDQINEDAGLKAAKQELGLA